MLKIAYLAVTALAGRFGHRSGTFGHQRGYIRSVEKTTSDGASREPILSLLKGLLAELHISAPDTLNETE